MIQHARRLLLSFGLAFAMAIGGAVPAAMAQVPYLSLIPQDSSKYASIVVDAKTGEVLYAKRADAPRYPASITKVMTLYLTFEALSAGRISLDDRVVFSPHAAAQAPTKLGIRAGDSISVLEAIQAMCTLSANDASVAMAEKLGGTEQRFAALMTLRAQELGMTNTNFANANGLPNTRNLSTARDIAILSRAAMRDYPQYYRFFSQVSFEFRGRTITNHNHMLSNTPGVDGLKTGFTNASGFNIAISGVKDGRRLIVVVLGGPTR
ncbi:MAG: D-alanyl-D-alanine carboxypeptidase, partial [Phenylobacterium sp.]|nr:D-alanyl-D-alanine carboxypeptidase [Phenylobacterium sp.]